MQQTSEPARAACVIDIHSAKGPIEKRWFGHNLEHTRSSVWHGLSAQILRNRKFAGKPEQVTGQAMGWYAIGPRQTCSLVDSEGAYTRHYNSADRRRRNEVQCQRIQGYVPGERSGLGQDGLPLVGGQAYRLRLALQSIHTLPVRVSVLRGEPAQGAPRSVYYEATLEVAPGEWRVYALEFSMPETDSAARLEITFEGIGELAIGMASLLPAHHWHGLRPDVVALLKEIGTPILRWPGGNFAGDYRWQDGLLDVDQRAPLGSFMEIETLPHTLGFDMHEIGIDEFIALCREVGAEPFLSINLAWESPAQSAAWVEYCNGLPGTGQERPWAALRAARGHPEPYRVQAWSLGNELGYGHMEGPNTPRAYADKAYACAEAMQQVDPTLSLVSSGTWQREDWFTEGLVLLAPVIEHISHHSYTPQLRHYGGAEAVAELRTLMVGPAHDFAVMREIRDQISAYAPQGRFIGISFDEWNVWYAWYRLAGRRRGALCSDDAQSPLSGGRGTGHHHGPLFRARQRGRHCRRAGSRDADCCGPGYAPFSRAPRPHQCGGHAIPRQPDG